MTVSISILTPYPAREYTVDFLQKVAKKLLSNLRRIVEDTQPYSTLREELEKEFFDPLH